MPDRLYVAWQDDKTRSWHTVARVTRTQLGYEFVFTRGVERLQSIPQNLFRMDPRHTYRFESLIPFLRNKIPSRNRADFAKIASWLNASESDDEFDLLSKFGLIQGTDSLLLYAEPSIKSGCYSLDFFVHGIRHMHKDAVEWCSDAAPGKNLLPLLDVQNPFDANAVALRCGGEALLIGYVPAFYSRDFRTLLGDEWIAPRASVTIIRNNLDAPVQLRLLCRFTSPVVAGFQPLDTEAHKPVTELESA